MRRALPAISLVLVLVAAAASAEEAGRPRLGDHEFVPVTDLMEPFLTTHVQTTVSLGQAVDTAVPVIAISDSTLIGTTEADLLIAALGFNYQQVVKDWLAVRLDIMAAGRLGTSTPTLLAEGFTGAVGYNLAWLLRVHRSRSLQLSTSLGLGTRSATFVNLIDWAQGILDGDSVALARSRNSLRGSAGLHAAWGLSRRFGLLGAYALDYGESFDGRGENRWSHDTRLALSYDAGTDLGIPLGAALAAGRFERNEGGDSDTGTWFWSLRVEIQGRDDFTLGLCYRLSSSKSPRTERDLRLGQLAVDMRYFY
jgi:hypothetical protein